MCPHIIAIDAGGTKTKAAIRNTKTQQTFLLNAGAASLSHNLHNACKTIKTLVEKLTIKAKVSPSDCVLVCGVAGAGLVKNAQALSDAVGDNLLDKLITTDAQTSLYGAGEGASMIVVAVGTGSVAMRLDENGVESMVGGWGFTSGDLGSGAEIGRQVITRVLVEYDKTHPGYDPMVNEVLSLIGSERQSILDWLKVATASDYARFAPIVFAEYMRSTIAKDIIHTAAKDIEELVESFSNDRHLPIAIIGGLSGQIKGYLSEQLQHRLIEPKGNAIDGAFFLGQRLLKQNLREKTINRPL